MSPEVAFETWLFLLHLALDDPSDYTADGTATVHAQAQAFAINSPQDESLGDKAKG